MILERLQKIIAHSGLYSRRQAEEFIRQGQVLVNGKRITQLGTKIDPIHSRIMVNGKMVKIGKIKELMLFHKPRQCVVTKNDPEGRKTIYDYLPKKFHHLKPVGRLDYDSSGLLILTNDGVYANQLAHPRYHLKKVYHVKVTPRPGKRQIERIRKGILLDGRRTLPVEAEVIRENPKSAWIQMVLQEGRNRQIRRMCEKVGLTVKALERESIGPYRLSGIAVGKWSIAPLV